MLHSVTHVYKPVLVGHRIVLSPMPVRPAVSRHDREVMGDNIHSFAQIEPMGVKSFVAGRTPAPYAVRITLGSVPTCALLERGLSILAEILDHPPEPCATVV